MDNCHGCGKPIIPNEDPRYTGREPEEHWHYSCWDKTRPPPTNLSDLRAQLATSIIRAENALDELRKVLKK